MHPSRSLCRQAWQDGVSRHNSRPARPRPFLVSDRSWPKTDGLRPHHWLELPQTSRQQHGATQRVKGCLCRWEKDILALALRHCRGGAHVVFSAGEAAEFEVLKLRYW